MTRDEFWTLIYESKAATGQDTAAQYDYLKDKLTATGPEEILRFHGFVRCYEDAANKYGLWDAAAVMCQGCSDDGFIDFRAWLIAQGADVYFAALENPDSLAEVTKYADCSFELFSYVGDEAYTAMTGRSAYDDFTLVDHSTLLTKLQAGIEYAPGIEYPRDTLQLQSVLPNLWKKYMTGDGIRVPLCWWNLSDPEIKRLLNEGREFDRRNDPNTVHVVKLYSPLTAEIEVEEEPDDPWYEASEPYMEPMLGGDLVYYLDTILQGISDEEMPEEKERGLMTYYHEDDTVNQKVISVKPTAEVFHNVVYGVAVCEVKGVLTGEERTKLEQYIEGQYSDGWGEGFEQRPRHTEYGDMYVHFWQSDNFSLRTQDEMEQDWQRRQQRQKGGGAR